MTNAIVKPDRGTVKRITLDLLYPNGQLKTVVLDNSSEEIFGTFSMIIFDEDAMENFLLKNVGALENLGEDSVRTMWKEVKKGDQPQWSPAFLILNSDGKLIAMCGGHKKTISPNVTVL